MCVGFHRLLKLTIVMSVFGSAFFWLLSPVHAAAFSNLVIRPERLAAGASPGRILVQARISENASEDGLRVTLGSAWSGSATAGLYTVATDNLPNGVTAWPSIGSATSVAGQVVTFPSGDLTPGTLYGFYLTGGIPSNPSVAGSNYQYSWKLETLQGGVPSSESDAAMSVLPNDQVTISGIILPPASDYSVQVQGDDGGSTLSQNTTITYTITYGSTYGFSTPLTLQATWPLGTIEGSGTPSVEFLEYVAGSASNAYGGAAPVIDLQARAITWTIASLPGNTTGQTVSFQLKTTESYQGSSTLTGAIKAHITEPIATADSQAPITYQYVPSVAPPDDDADDEDSDEQSSQDKPDTPVATPQPQDSPDFSSYELIRVGNTNATIRVELTSSAAVIAFYGTSPDALKQTINSQSATTHTFALSNLQPATTYFVRFTLSDGTQSELLEFKTAQAELDPSVISVQLTSDGLFYWSGTANQQNPLLFPSGWPLEITVSLQDDAHTSTITIYAAGDQDTGEYLTSLTRTQSGVWSGRVPAIQGSGNTSFWATVTTSTGLLKQIPLFNLLLSDQLTVVDDSTGQPIERARLEMYTKDPVTQIYKWLAAPEFLLQNPLYTTAGGRLPIALSPADYRFDISAVGYVSQQVDFSLLNANSFPSVRLQRGGNVIVGSIFYHAETIRLKLAQYFEIFKHDAQSPAVIQLVTWWTLLFSTPFTIAFLLSAARFSLPDFWRTSFVGAALGATGVRRKRPFISGAVLSETTKKLLSNAVITIQDYQGKTRQVIQSLRGGRFIIQRKYCGDGATANIFALGYKPAKVDLDEAADQLEVRLSPEGESTSRALISVSLKHVALNVFFLNLLVSLLLGAFFAFLYGNSAALPFFVLSVINIVIFVVTIF